MSLINSKPYWNCTTLKFIRRYRRPIIKGEKKKRSETSTAKFLTRGRSQSEKFDRLSCKYILKGTCTKSRCEYWHPPECQFHKTKSGCKFGAECPFPHWKVARGWSPRQAFNRRRRTREGLELACVQTPWHGWHRREKRRINVLPWYRLVGVAKTSTWTQRRKKG